MSDKPAWLTMYRRITNSPTESKAQIGSEIAKSYADRDYAAQAAQNAQLAAAPNIGSRLTPEQANAALKAMQDKVAADALAADAAYEARPVDLQGYAKRPSKR